MRAVGEGTGVTAAMQPLLSGGIGRSLGKARRVVDRRPEE